MRFALFVATMLATLSALGAEPQKMPAAKPDAGKSLRDSRPVTAKPEPPPSPPPAIYEVWTYKWDGRQYAKQPSHFLKTTDLLKAAQYSNDMLGNAGWICSVNLPQNCYQHHIYHDPTVPHWAQFRLDGPDRPVYEVWAFKLTDGKWIKDEEYSWSSRDRKGSDVRYVALDLAKRVNAVPGWCATTNAPDFPTPNPLYVDLGYVRGYSYTCANGSCGSSAGYSRGGYPVYSEHGGRTIYRPHMTIRLGADADWSYRHTPHDEPRNDP